MDKQTLSNYGWIVICVLVLATLIAFATPFGTFIARGFETATTGFSFTTGNAVSDTIGDLNPTPLSELQERHKFDYYSSLALAVDDINAGTIGKNADRNKDNAVAGVYVYKGMPYAVLLKDNTEDRRVEPKVDMSINIGGNTLKSTDPLVINAVSGNIIIDSRLKNSTIYTDIVPQNRILQVKKDASVQVKGGTYISMNSTQTDFSAINTTIIVRGSLVIDDATIITNAVGHCDSISTKDDDSKVVVRNSTIKATSSDAIARVGGNTSTTTYEGCNIEICSEKQEAFGICMRKYDEAIQGVVTTNIYNTKIKITSPKNIQGIRISAEVTDNAIINIENSMIETVSDQSSVTLIYSQLCPSSTQINITKSDLIGVSNSDTNISYGIFGNNNTRASINRSTILVNKHLEKTDIKNSIGIYGTNDIANTYSTIFGTKANIE